MLNMLEKVFMTIIGGEFIIGILGNGFIGLTNCLSWVRNQKLCLVDLILTSLAFARISVLWLTIVSLFSVLASQEILAVMKVNHILSNIWILANHLSTWLATCLAVFYLLKIANYSSPLFLWLKRRTDKVVFTLLLLSVPFLVPCFPLSDRFDVFWYYALPKYKRNVTGIFNEHGSKHLDYIIMFMTGSLAPFSVASLSFFLLLFSLWRHTQRLRLSVRSSGDASTEAHFRAMKTVLFFLVLFVLHQFAFFMTFWGHFLPQNKLVLMLSYTIDILYPSGHSYVVIFGNSQMRKAFWGIPGRLKRGLKGKATSR